MDPATRLGLTVSGLMTNGVRHAFERRERGQVGRRLRSLDGGAVRVEVPDDGVARRGGTAGRA